MLLGVNHNNGFDFFQSMRSPTELIEAVRLRLENALPTVSTMVWSQIKPLFDQRNGNNATEL